MKALVIKPPTPSGALRLYAIQNIDLVAQYPLFCSGIGRIYDQGRYPLYRVSEFYYSTYSYLANEVHRLIKNCSIIAIPAVVHFYPLATSSTTPVTIIIIYRRDTFCTNYTPDKPSDLYISMDHGGYNILSIVMPDGKMQYSVKEGNINGGVFIDVLNHLIQNRQRPLILFVDHASFHSSKPVRDFVRAHRAKLRIFFLPKRAPDNESR